MVSVSASDSEEVSNELCSSTSRCHIITSSRHHVVTSSHRHVTSHRHVPGVTKTVSGASWLALPGLARPGPARPGPGDVKMRSWEHRRRFGAVLECPESGPLGRTGAFGVSRLTYFGPVASARPAQARFRGGFGCGFASPFRMVQSAFGVSRLRSGAILRSPNGARTCWFQCVFATPL